MPKKYSVLIIDDSPEVAEVLEYLIEDFAEYVTLNSFDKISTLKGKNFDFILCDLHIPNIQPSLLVPELFKVFPSEHSHIIIVSGSLINDPLVKTCFNQGASGFLEKPIADSDEVLKLFEQINSAHNEKKIS